MQENKYTEHLHNSTYTPTKINNLLEMWDFPLNKYTEHLHNQIWGVHECNYFMCQTQLK